MEWVAAAGEAGEGRGVGPRKMCTMDMARADTLRTGQARLGFENIHVSTCKGRHLGNQVAKGVRAQICVSTYPVSGWRLPAEQSARFDARSPPRLNNPTQ